MSSQLCESAVSRPIQVQLDVTRASSLVAVSFPSHLLHLPFQKRSPGLQLLCVRCSERGRLETLVRIPGVFWIVPQLYGDSFLWKLLWSNRMVCKHAVLDTFFRN